MGHSGRCIKVICNFTHPSRQTENRVYPPSSFVYSYEADHVPTRRAIESHAKGKYASKNKLKSGWIGFITTSDQVKFNISADSDLKETYTIY